MRTACAYILLLGITAGSLVLIVRSATQSPYTEEGEGFFVGCSECGHVFVVPREQAPQYPKKDLRFRCEQCGAFACQFAPVCDRCGKHFTLTDGLTNCPNCNAPIPGAQPPTSESPTQDK